jgi:hypothetical protein
MKNIYKIIFILILNICINDIYSKELSKLYVNKFTYNDKSSENFEKKFRNLLIDKLIKNYSDKYSIMDEDSVQSLKDKLNKKKALGCSEEDCIREISQSVDADEIISGEVNLQEKGIIINIKNSLKQKKDSFGLNIKSIIVLEISENQLDYYIQEIASKLINPSYKIDTKNAPLAENQLETPIVSTLPDLSSIPIPKVLQINQNSSSLITVNNKDAEMLANRGEFLKAINILRDNLDIINVVSNTQEKKTLDSFKKAIEDSIRIYAEKEYRKRIDFLLAYEKSNSPLTEKALLSSQGISAWEVLEINYNKDLRESEKTTTTAKLINDKILSLKNTLKVIQARNLIDTAKAFSNQKKYIEAYNTYQSAIQIVGNSDKSITQEINSLITELQNKKREEISTKTNFKEATDMNHFSDLIIEYKVLRLISGKNKDLLDYCSSKTKEIVIERAEFQIQSAENKVKTANTSKKYSDINNIYSDLNKYLLEEYKEWKYIELQEKNSIYREKETNIEQVIIKSYFEELETFLVADNIEAGRQSYDDIFFRKAVKKLEQIEEFRKQTKSNYMQKELEKMSSIISNRMYNFTSLQSFSYNKHCLTTSCNKSFNNFEVIYSTPINFMSQVFLIPNAEKNNIFYSFYFSIASWYYFYSEYNRDIDKYNSIKNDPFTLYAITNLSYPYDRYIFEQRSQNLSDVRLDARSNGNATNLFAGLSILLYWVGLADLPSTGKYFTPGPSKSSSFQFKVQPEIFQSRAYPPNQFNMTLQYTWEF